MSEKQLPANTETAIATAKAAGERWRKLWWLPCELSLQIPVVRFTVRELLRLGAGSIVTTSWSRSTEIPLRANGQLIGWTEFEAVGGHIGARITELV